MHAAERCDIIRIEGIQVAKRRKVPTVFVVKLKRYEPTLLSGEPDSGWWRAAVSTAGPGQPGGAHLQEQGSDNIQHNGTVGLFYFSRGICGADSLLTIGAQNV